MTLIMMILQTSVVLVIRQFKKVKIIMILLILIVFQKRKKIIITMIIMNLLTLIVLIILQLQKKKKEDDFGNFDSISINDEKKEEKEDKEEEDNDDDDEDVDENKNKDIIGKASMIAAGIYNETQDEIVNKNDNDDFDSFDQDEIVKANKSNDNDFDDFGNFDDADIKTNDNIDDHDKQTETNPIDTTNNNEDDFGDFDDFNNNATTTDTNNNDNGNGNGEDDFGDFGDFGDFDNGANTAANDDFGDFGDFGDFDNGNDNFDAFNEEFNNDETNIPTTTAETENVSTVPQQQSIEVQQPVLTPELQEFINSSIITNIIQSAFNDDPSLEIEAIKASLNNIYPDNEFSLDFNDVEEIQSILNQIPPQTEKVQEDDIENPIHTAESEHWYKLWNRFTEENNYKENAFNQFKWQNSQIRKHYLVNLDIPINLDEFKNDSFDSRSNSKIKATSPKTSRLKFLKLKKNNQGGNKKSTEKDREIDIDDINEKYEKARELANIDPESLKSKSKKELQELIKSVIEATQNCNEYLNYVLDQKEQLKMDAEMHDKMIACLVQHAKQKQMAPKSSKGLSNSFMSSSKKGKKSSKH